MPRRDRKAPPSGSKRVRTPQPAGEVAPRPQVSTERDTSKPKLKLKVS
jgi:hypothetical protein